MASLLTKYTKKLLDIRNSLIGKIVVFFVIIFILLLTPTVIQTYTSFQQARAYREMINNIAYANQLRTDVSTRVEPAVWDIVAGKVTFEDSGILMLIADIRDKMNYIRANTYSEESSGIMDVSLRGLGTLEDYVGMLGRQIRERKPVEENENVFEEIMVCVALINDLLQEFSSKELAEVAVMNEEMAARGNIYFTINLALIAVVGIAGVYAFWYIYKSIMNPIDRLLDMSNRISAGDFSCRVELAASDEFNELAAGMNKMSEQIELLLAKGIEEQQRQRMLEARALQAQITPHFLYNTLDAIIWAAEDDNMEDVIRLVASLSSFFRISLSHGIDFITISNEIEHVRSYLTIQQMRYSDILTYDIHVDEGLGELKILKLLLQPLVENALYHGIKNTRERGKINISVTRTPGGVRFAVSDDGIGMTAERLETLRAELGKDDGPETGYGLFNVNRRLKLYYDMQDGIDMRSEYRKGTEVSFTLDIVT